MILEFIIGGIFHSVWLSMPSYFRFPPSVNFHLYSITQKTWCLFKGFMYMYLLPYIHVRTIPYQALEKAKEAGRKERVLVRQREQQSMGDQINLDLTYSVSTLLTLFMELDCVMCMCMIIK